MSGKRFACSVSDCPFLAPSRSVLREHECGRHGRTDHCKKRCDECGFETAYSSVLSRHRMQQHRAADRVNTFQCSTCGRELASRDNLRRHLRDVHFKCTIRACNVLSEDKEELLRHMEAMHGIKLKVGKTRLVQSAITRNTVSFLLMTAGPLGWLATPQ